VHKSLSNTVLGSLLALAAMAGTAAAQYRPIPNFTGIGAGFNFRQAINQRFSGAAPISPQIIGYFFGSLPAEQDGLLAYCKDCTSATLCTSGGTGAWAFGQRGQWTCSLGGSANLSSYTGAVGVTGNSGNGSDAISNVNINGSLNVKAYGAKGDGTTDDTAAIQAAIAASCASPGGNKPVVFLPSTPGGLCYKTTAPLLLNCSTSFTGPAASLNGAASICQNYLGPAIIAQSQETSWAPPLASSIANIVSFAPLANVWQASHAYVAWKEILDSNGNVQFVKTAGTSGSGSHPTWATTQGATTTDGTVTWQLGMIGTQLASGSGSALDTVDQEFFPGSGYGGNNGPIELNNSGKLDGFMNGAAAFTVEFYVNLVVTFGKNNLYLVGMEPGQPMPSNIPAFQIYLTPFAGGSCTNANPCWVATADIGGVQRTIFQNTVPIVLGVTHHCALTYNGSTLRLFVDGTQVGSVAATGTWTVPAYESFLLPDGGNQCYPGQCAPNFGEALAYWDSLRVSNTARYASNFTAPTAKFASDANTIFLENFPTNTPAGTIESFNGRANQNAFIPIETSNGAAALNPAYIGNLNLSGNGIWATWMLNSTIENINLSAGVGGDHLTCINLANNDFQDTVRRVVCATGFNDGTTRVGFVFGNQSNNNVYDHLQCDGQRSCIGELGGSGHYIMPDFTDRVDAIYPLYFVQAQAVLDSPELDIEDTAANQLAAVYSSGAYAPIIINGGQLFSGNPSGGAYLAIRGGQPFIDTGTLFGGGAPAELLNVLSNPTSPVTIKDTSLPNVPLTNAGAQQWLVVNTFGAAYNPGPSITSPSYAVGAYDRYLDCNATSNAVALNLPAATGSGRLISFKKTDSSTNACTITCGSSDKIDGVATDALASQYAGLTLRDSAAGMWDIVK
jgi:hypothetical protein